MRSVLAVIDSFLSKSRNGALGWALLFAMLFSVVSLFVSEINEFLSPLKQPMPLRLAFFSSLVFAMFSEMGEGGISKGIFVKFLSLSLVFYFGVFFAIHIRQEYVDFLTSMLAEPEMKEFVGEDYMSLLANRAVGFAGSFGVGLLISRLAFGKLLSKVCLWLFVPKDALLVCPHCGK